MVKGIISPSKIVKYLHLQLPKAKLFVVKSLDHPQNRILFPAMLSDAVNRSRLDWSTKLPRFFRHIQTSYTYPIAQGPINLPIETRLVGGGPTAQQVLTARTIFNHSDSQICGKWNYVITGISSWGAIAPDPLLSGIESKVAPYVVELLESEQTIQGAASNIDMTLMYTCQLNKCRIYCPCAICNDVRETCKLLCKEFPCQNCNSQCNKHAVKIPRTFNPEEDLFTLITNKLT